MAARIAATVRIFYLAQAFFFAFAFTFLTTFFLTVFFTFLTTCSSL